MTEKRMSKRSNWKAQTFNYDYYIPDESEECSYCLTLRQAEILMGIIEPLGWDTRWWSDATGIIDHDTIVDFRDDITRRLMMSCCDTFPLQFRFDPETGAYQVSKDGGATWEDAPQYDPRQTSTVFPPPSSVGIDTTKCQNADSLVEYIKQEMITAINEDMAISAILGVVGTAILSLASGGTLLFFSGLLDAVVSGIFAFGVIAWQAAFTTTVYNDLRCEIYCDMDTDDSIDDAGITKLLAFITSHYTGIVQPTLYGYINAMGRVGATNAIRSNRGDPDADCAGCCPICEDLFTWPTSVFGANSTIAIDHTLHTITADAIESNPGEWYWAFQSTTCCTCTVDVTVGTPTFDFRGVIPCPTLPEFSYGTETSPPWTLFTLPIVNTPAFVLYMRSAVPFTAKVTFS